MSKPLSEWEVKFHVVKGGLSPKDQQGWRGSFCGFGHGCLGTRGELDPTVSQGKARRGPVPGCTGG